MLQRIWAVMQKQFIQTLRDRRTLMVIIALPILMLFLMGYAVEIQVDHIKTVVVDHSRDQRSWSFIEALENSGFFDIMFYVENQDEAIRAIEEGQARAAIVIPPDFLSAVERGQAQALVIIDGSDAMTVQSAYNAAITVAESYSVELLARKLERSQPSAHQTTLQPLDVRVRVLYNPDMKAIIFMLPGIVATILQNQATSLTAFSIVKEREAGTIEQLLVTPIRPLELMIGKLMPNVVLAFINMLTILGLGVFWFKVPFSGNIWLFFWMVLLFMVSSLGLGILISTVSSTQAQAQQLVLMILIPSLVLSGYIFPREMMPKLVRFAGDLIPMTYFLQIARGIITRGVGLRLMWSQVAALLIYSAIVLTLSAGSFKQRLE
jgi:ABC-2 type transport system permease protein